MFRCWTSRDQKRPETTALEALKVSNEETLREKQAYHYEEQRSSLSQTVRMRSEVMQSPGLAWLRLHLFYPKSWEKLLRGRGSEEIVLIILSFKK